MKLTRTVPVLPCRDLEETTAFYKQLGFTVARPAEKYLIVERDEAEIHFSLTSGFEAPARIGCYVVTTDVDNLYADFVLRGVEADPPIEQPWGLKELYVVDPSGNLVWFAQEMGASG